ncbi:hypothetical protein PROFUN_17055, partial [Planoprotostelium fungivorum]
IRIIILLQTVLVGYAETIICDKCKKVFSYSNSTKYHKHMAKHQKDQNSSKNSTSLYKQSFDIELVRPLFLAYDFECILKKMNNNKVNQKTTYTHSHEPIGVVMLAGGCLADQARGFEYEYCGPDAGRHFVDHLNSIHDTLRGLLKTYFWKHHNKQMAVIETQKCSCQYTLQHRPWCKETTPTDQPCRCGHCRQHKKGCKYIVTKCLIMKEYLSIPIQGFNSGKYDLTFIITHMQKYDISPPITKTNSYMKLEYEYGPKVWNRVRLKTDHTMNERGNDTIRCLQLSVLMQNSPALTPWQHEGSKVAQPQKMTGKNNSIKYKEPSNPTPFPKYTPPTGPTWGSGSITIAVPFAPGTENNNYGQIHNAQHHLLLM